MYIHGHESNIAGLVLTYFYTWYTKGEEAIRAQLDKTLADLGVEYLDLYLIHWPVPGKHGT